MIRSANIKDAQAIADIYNYFVMNTVVTFEEEPVTPDEMWNRIKEVQEKYCWLVYEAEGKVVGYAYAGKWKVRSAYKHTVESSIYLAPGNEGKGIGKKLYAELIAQLKALGIHAIIGGVAQPNAVSDKFHETMNFKKIGEFIEVGYKFNNWVNVRYWELIFPQQ
ncbi:MAG: phosphinothricin acetyltransferase [Flavipsychrobacter sp.]|jgi:phosphinothricin acetyltransferase|nr:phosphinothricin acetyltransferase [Flavipsychrobacter sp.]